MNWEIIAALIAALGGREFIMWVVYRKARARKENAIAKEAELSVHERQIERYEQKLMQLDAKVDSLYVELRSEQRKNIELTEKNNKLGFDIEVISLQKCEVRGCALRKPPGVY